MVEGNLKNTIEKLKALKTEAAQQATEAAVENKKVTTRENEILASIKDLEDSLPPVIGTVTDSKAFRVEDLTYLKIEWFLYFDKKIKILYTETPTEKAEKQGTTYIPKREERDIYGYNISILELIDQQLPEFAELLYQNVEKFKKQESNGGDAPHSKQWGMQGAAV